MGWLPIIPLKDPIYPKLVQAFYSNVLLQVGGPITISSTLRGVDIMLNEQNMYQLLVMRQVWFPNLSSYT